MDEKRIRVPRKQKRRRRIYKRVLKLTLWLFAVAFVLWALAGWYLGGKAEQAFKAYLQTHTEVVGEKLLRVELLSYRKTLFGAKAQLRLSSDIPVVSDRVGEVSIRARLLNGPLFITKNGISVGSSRWFLKIDESQLSEDERQNIHAIFPHSLPTAIVRTDFKQKAHYLAKLKTDFAQALVTGVYSFKTENQEEFNRGAITLNNVSYGITPNKLSADSISLSYQHQQAISAGYKPGTTSIRIPVLHINHASLHKPISVNLNAKSNLSTENDFLNGFIKLDVKQLDIKQLDIKQLDIKQEGIENEAEPDLPLDTATLSLLFKGLSAEGLIAFSEASANLDNLKQQIDWTLEDQGAFPEGRDEIIHLYDEIETASKALNGVVLKEVFQGKNSVLQLDVETQQGDKVSSLKGSFKSVEDKNQSDSYFSLVTGKVDIQLSENMYDFMEHVLKQNEPSSDFVLKKQFKIELKNNKLLFH